MMPTFRKTAIPRLLMLAGAQALISLATGPALAQSYGAGAIVVEAPWSRATPGGAKVASGYMRIVNRGSDADRLIGGTTTVAGRFELHESSDAGGVARMTPLANGLAIKPGESVELKPGGLHVMLADLKAPLKEGDVISGTLVFEKAGTVEVRYRVGGIGAQSAGGPHHQH